MALTYYFYPDASCSAATCQLYAGGLSSTDGGRTWSTPVRFNAVPMAMAWLANTTQGYMVGDDISTAFIGGLGLLPVLLLVGAVVGAIFLWRRSKQQRERERVTTEAEMSEDRDLLRAELSVLAEDVMRLEPQIALHPDAAADYEAGVSRYRVAQAALDAADDPIDLVRVRRVMDEGQYAMSRARAIIEGREPPPPPADLTRRGRHDEPPVDLDDRGRPQYAGYDAPFYGGGGGWFGGGGGLLTGLFLGQMLGGWGGGHQTVYVDQGDGGGGDAGDASAGDWGGGGDWGDFGGGDFGGGDVGGGDW